MAAWLGSVVVERPAACVAVEEVDLDAVEDIGVVLVVERSPVGERPLACLGAEELAGPGRRRLALGLAAVAGSLRCELGLLVACMRRRG